MVGPPQEHAPDLSDSLVGSGATLPTPDPAAIASWHFIEIIHFMLQKQTTPNLLRHTKSCLSWISSVAIPAMVDEGIRSGTLQAETIR